MLFHVVQDDKQGVVQEDKNSAKRAYGRWTSRGVGAIGDKHDETKTTRAKQRARKTKTAHTEGVRQMETQRYAEKTKQNETGRMLQVLV